MNKLFLIGNLTKDPELMQTEAGTPVCHFTLAVNRDYVNEDGTREADFFNITTWRNQAESCGKYLTKGNKVAVTGVLRNRQYKDSQGVERYTNDIIATEVEFLYTKPKEETAPEVEKQETKPAKQAKETKPVKLAKPAKETKTTKTTKKTK